MKGIKTILGIALATTGFGGAIAVGAVSASQNNKVEVVEAAASNVTNGNKRINVIIPSKTNTWIFDSSAKIFSSGVSDSVKDFDFAPDTDIGSSTKNATVRNMGYEIDGEDKWIATKSLGKDFSTTWWDFSVERHSGSSYWNKQTYQNGKVWINNCNTYYYDGNSLAPWGYYYKVAFHTGTSLENVSYSIRPAYQYQPDNPQTISGYRFDGWYKESSFTNKFTKETLTGDINLFAKYTAVPNYTITKYAVVNGTNVGSIGTDIVPEGTTYNIPDAIQRDGYVFGGWYSNEACTTKYTATTISANKNIYAKYSSTTEGSVYFKETGTDLYAYTYETDYGELLGSYPGTKITSKTATTNFEPVSIVEHHGIYKISFQYVDINNLTLVISEGQNQAKTKDLKVNASGSDQQALTLGTYYYPSANNNLWDNLESNANAGLAAALIYDTEAKVRAATDSSVCNVSPSDASSLVSRYAALNATAKGYVDANSTTVYTYAGQDKSSYADIKYADIFARLGTIASGNQSRMISIAGVDNNVFIIIISSAIIVSVGACAFFLLKKKKHN